MPSNNYTRQKAAEIQDNLTINASIFNAEYNQIQLAFSYASTGETGHTHSGAAGEGGAIGKIGNQDFSKSLEISTNDWVFTGSSVQPATDNTTDLGVSGKGWKDVYVSGNVNLTDNAKAQFGTGNDLQIWHSGTQSYIQDAGTGNLNIQTNGASIKLFDDANSVNLATFITGGAANLYWAGNNAEVRLSTTEAGIDVTGIIDCDGIKMDDGEYAQFGTDNDLKIWHSGSNSFIQESGVGQLVLTTTNGAGIYVESAGEAMGQFISNGPVNLFHDGDLKLSTNSTGIDVTGTVTADGVNLGNNEKITFGGTTSPNLEIYETSGGTGLIVQNGSGDLVIKGQIGSLQNDAGSSLLQWDATNVSLYWRGTSFGQRLVTTETGIDVTGTVTITDPTPQLILKDSSDSDDHAIKFRDTANADILQITSANNHLNFITADNTKDILLRPNSATVVRVDTTGIDVTGTVDCDGVNLGNNEKITFGGTSADYLQIYEGTNGNAYVEQIGVGNLYIKGENGYLRSNSVDVASWGSVDIALKYNGVNKLLTTNNGIDVTGTTNTDNLTINGAQGSDGQVLTSTGSGVAWEDAATGGGGSVTAVTGTAPIVSSGGTAPAISITQASGSTNGYLSSTDWTTFNNKGAGTLTGVTEGAAIDINTANAASPTISVDLSELTVETDDLVGSTDHLVYLDNGNQKKILANNVNLSAFDNDVGWTNNAGTVTSVSGGTGITVTGGGTSPSVSITSDSIGATQLNVSGNGAATDFLRSDGDGTFTWATPVDTNTTYTADNTTIDLTGTEFSVKDNGIGATQLNVSGNGSSSQFLRSDGDGTFTWATPTDTNTTYTAGVGLLLNVSDFNLSLNELPTTTTASATSYLVLSGTVGNKILLENIDNHLFGQDVQELSGFGPLARRANSIKVIDTSLGDISAAWQTGVEGAYYTVHAIGANDINYVIPSGTTVYITGPSGLITKTFGSTVTIKGGSSCTVTAYGSSETFIYTGNNVTYS